MLSVKQNPEGIPYMYLILAHSFLRKRLILTETYHQTPPKKLDI